MSTVRKIALVTGGTGVIGPVLVAKLASAGYDVRVLARHYPPVGLLPAEVTIIRGDIADAESVRRAMDSVDFVFHLAAKLHVNNPGPHLRGEYERVNVEGTRLVVEAAEAAGVERIVYFSTIAVYDGNRSDEPLTEDSLAFSDTLYAVTKWQAEQLVLAAKRRDGEAAGVVLRIAAVYGPWVKGNYRTLVNWLKRGVFFPIGDGTNRRTVIRDVDVACAALLAAEHPAAAGKVFNVTDGSVHTFNEIIQAISQALGRRPPRLRVSPVLANGLARVADGAFRLRGRKGPVRPLIDKMMEDMAVSGQRIQDVLGFRPQFDLRAGWNNTVRQIADRQLPNSL